MVLIRVQQKDANKVFSILLHNGRFSEIKGNKFRIDENAKATINEIKEKKIIIEEL